VETRVDEESSHDQCLRQSPNRSPHRREPPNRSEGLRGARERVLETPRDRSGQGPRAAPAAGALDALVGELAERIAASVESRLAELLEGLDERQTPRLLDRRGLAAALGVCADTVDRLRREGMPELIVGDAPRFDFAGEVLPWLKARRS
jgi:hypothetical protein